MENEKNTFPITKIKAQLLRDDNVGRVSTKAVELIAACSSLFVNDLVTKSIEKTAPTRKASSKTKNNDTADDVALVTLRQIKKSVKTSQEYSFLDGVLDGVSERAAFKYDAAAAKKRKRLEDNNNNTKEKNNSSKKSTSVAKLPVEARESVDDNNKVENKALREAIETASQSNGGAGKGNTIIEDEDDYD